MVYLLFYDDIELSGSDVSEEPDRGDGYFIDSLLDACELFSLSEVVSETPSWN